MSISYKKRRQDERVEGCLGACLFGFLCFIAFLAVRSWWIH